MAARASGRQPGNDAGVFRALLGWKIYQDRLMWSRTQTLLGLQALVLGGSYAARSEWLAPALLVVGAILTGLVWFLAWADSRDRHLNNQAIDLLSTALLPEGVEFRFTEAANGLRVLRGNHIVVGVTVGFVVIDILLALFYCYSANHS